MLNTIWMIIFNAVSFYLKWYLVNKLLIDDTKIIFEGKGLKWKREERKKQKNCKIQWNTQAKKKKKNLKNTLSHIYEYIQEKLWVSHFDQLGSSSVKYCRELRLYDVYRTLKRSLDGSSTGKSPHITHVSNIRDRFVPRDTPFAPPRSAIIPSYVTRCT